MNIPNKPDFDKLWIAAGKKIKEKNYWLEKLSGEPVKSNFPYNHKKSDFHSRIETSIFLLNGPLYSDLMRLSTDSDIRLHIVLTAVLTLLLARYSGNDDIIVGTPIITGTPNNGSGTEFINTILALRNRIRGNATFKEFLFQVRQTVIEANENKDYPFEILIRQLNLPETPGTCPLFDVGIALENIQDRGYFSNLTPKVIFFFSRLENCIECHVQYDTGFYHQPSIKRITDHFQRLLEVILSNIEINLSQIDLLLPDERDQLIVDFNATAVPYPKDKTIHELFEDQVNRIGDRIALVGKGIFVEIAPRVCPQLSYNELDKRSDELASELTRKGVGPDVIVGIKIQRSIEMIIGIIGILKSGGAYLPLGVDYPQERIDYMLKDSSAKFLFLTEHTEDTGRRNLEAELLLATEVTEDTERGVIGDRLFVSTNNKEGKKLRSLEDQIAASSGHLTPLSSYPLTFTTPPVCSVRNHSRLAYVIYTSGSTGMPKGVMVEHRHVIRLVKNTNFISFNPGGHILQTGALEFDASTFEIWGSLLNGLSLYLMDKEDILNPGTLKQGIIRHNITTMWMTSPLFNQMVQQDVDIFQGLHYLVVGGDVLSPSHINRVMNHFPNLKIVNGYGPTENTTFSTTFLINRQYEEKIPIGKPIANSTAYIVDQFERLQPIGVAGELWVGGDGVARGYLNHPELTFERFRLRRPGALFEKTAPGPRKNVWFGRVYKTGDWCRWLEDGNIEFLGRIDHQLKIRGFRVEPGEIENRLLKHPAVREAVVVVKEDKGGNKSLVSYIVFNNKNNKPDVVTLKTDLANNLPDYMIPSFVVPVERIPLTANGKVDWRALPEPQVNSAQGQGPRNDGEETMATLWTEVLGVARDRLSIDSDFFELGGHSLKAALLVSKIHKAFDITVPLAEVFTSPTIRKLSNFIRRSSIEKFDPINSVEKKEYYALSSAQKRLYILHQMDEKGIAYNMPTFFILEGDVDKERLERAFELLVNRHESLRTSFQMIDGEPVQRVEDKIEFKIDDSLTGLTGDTEGEGKKLRSEEVEKIRKIDHKYFDLRKAPLIRVGLMKIEESHHLLAVDMHHIISDGTSMNIIINDFMALYRGEFLPQLEIQYKDYSEWQHTDFHKELLKQQEVFWIREFEDEIPVLELPIDFTRPSVQSFEGNSISFTLNREITERLKAMASETETTLYMVLLSVYTLFLSTLTHQEDIVVGSPVAGRRHADLEPIIGMFVNTLAIRNVSSGEKTFREFLSQVKEKTLQVLENQDYPYEDLIERVIPYRDASRNPLFDTMFTLQNLYMQSLEIPGLTLSPYDAPHPVSKFDLTLSATESNDQLIFLFEYSTALFKPETIERFIIYFKNLIDQAVENKDKKISKFEIITEEEKKRILYEFNDTDKTYPNDKTLQELFVDQVEKTPDHLALISRTSVGALREAPSQISYRELDHQSDRLACELIEKGVAPDTIVALKIERSLEMIIGILGILKAGGAYLPIDPGLPQERINYMLKDSQARLLVTHFVGVDLRVCPAGAHMGAPLQRNICVGADPRVCPSASFLPATGNRQPTTSLAYVIYTSGSTGKPKGVLIRHSNVCPLLHWGYEAIALNPSDRSAQNLSYYFDWSVGEIFITLTSGASLWMVPGNVILDAIEYVHSMNRYGITVLHITPTHFQSLIHPGMQLETLRHLCIGAEKFPKELAELIPKLVDEKCRIYNMYGPTEATILSTALKIDKSQGSYDSLTSVPIGKGLGNNVHLILDRNFNLCPVGIAGELVIGGDGVAPGYLNNPELTAKSFISVSSMTSVAKKFYKTGDLCRWLPDGNIEYLNRMDQQVKIRGFRIELGEIESRLRSHKEIKDAVVAAKRSKTGDEYLCAYVIAETVEDVELKEYLSQSLPDYMIPSYFIQIDKIPLNANGKLNLKALPDPDIKIPEKRSAPSNEVEEKLMEIWAETLGISKNLIDINANFFRIGGHSLTGMRVTAAIHKVFGVKLSLAEFFKHPFLRDIAKTIKEAEKETFHLPEVSEEKEFYELSYNQRRLWIAHQFEPDNSAYNMPLKLVLTNPDLDDRLVKKVVRATITRHESLRTAFRLIDEKPVQVILPIEQVEIPFKFIDIHTADTFEKKQQSEEIFHQESQTPFDLSKCPLLRTILIKTDEDTFIIIFNMHHIISDGWSIELLKNDFLLVLEKYRNGEDVNELEHSTLQYKDFAEWLNKEVTRAQTRERAHQFWKKLLAKEHEPVNLPTDFTREDVSRNGSAYRWLINQETKDRLNHLAYEYHTSLFTTLLAAFNLFLSLISGQKDILIGIPLSGRDHAAFQHIVGFFVNTGLLSTRISDDNNFIQLLDRVHSDFMELLGYQSYPMELALDELNIKFPPINVFFNMLNFGTGNLKAKPDNPIPHHEKESGEVKFDLAIYMEEYENGIDVSCHYKRELFTQGSIESMMKKYVEILDFYSHRPEKNLLDFKRSQHTGGRRLLKTKRNNNDH
ncbi:MAG: amino acid adenylation domain-containing protein [Candidatus Omnitrophota bacterium]